MAMDNETIAMCLEVANGRYRSSPLVDLGVSEASLRSGMPPIAEQAYGATCTAHAVAALVAYAEDPVDPPALSPQFLFDVVKRNEDVWIGRNLESIKNGFEPDAEFRLAYQYQYGRLALVVKANGGPGTVNSQAFIAQFESQLRERTGIFAGSMIHRCFEAVREVGICREELRPTATIQRGAFVDVAGNRPLPRALLDDARKHRVVRGFHVFEHPNNVNEIRSVLAGARKLRPMPVCVAVEIFEGCTNGAFAFPAVDATGVIAARPLGLHDVLIVGFKDQPSEPGGGSFIVRNSWGHGWGDGGYGKMAYAYLEIFCREAGTILAYDETVPTVGHSAKAGEPLAELVCGTCGRRYLGRSSLKMTCEAEGCAERICFDCWSGGKKLCQKHSATMPKTI